MGDSHHHDPHEDAASKEAAPLAPLRLTSGFTPGGHEVDATPNRNLIAFLAVMGVLIVLASIGVYELFVAHTGEQLSEAASVPAPVLVEQNARDKEFATTWGKVVVDGKDAGWRMPFAEAKRLVLADPARFAPAPAPAGWMHPDDAGKK